MQTFFPLPDMNENARVLDRQRLGKQRVEAWQILQVLMSNHNGWRNHPAVRMWTGSELALCEYGLAICLEWCSRGFRDSMMPKFSEVRDSLISGGIVLVMPSWHGNDGFHAAHRSNLLRKDVTWYGKFGWQEPPDLPYVWPENMRA